MCESADIIKGTNSNYILFLFTDEEEGFFSKCLRKVYSEKVLLYIYNIFIYIIYTFILDI